MMAAWVPEVARQEGGLEISEVAAPRRQSPSRPGTWEKGSHASMRTPWNVNARTSRARHQVALEPASGPGHRQLRPRCPRGPP